MITLSLLHKTETKALWSLTFITPDLCFPKHTYRSNFILLLFTVLWFTALYCKEWVHAFLAQPPSSNHKPNPGSLQLLQEVLKKKEPNLKIPLVNKVLIL